MIQRLFWFIVGVGTGIGAARRVRRHATALVPAALAERARDALRSAVAEGRQEMDRRERALRAVLASPGAREAAK
jgi:siroheme synthase (precorrin-2 oxidase/ferrochelatase)